MLAVDTSPRPRRRRLPTFLAIVLVTAVLGGAGLIIAARRVVDAVQRVDGVAAVLSDGSANVENFLLVGSDSRVGADPSDPDFGGIGSPDEVTGNRSDTIMILRRDTGTGDAALLSIPRDLYVHVYPDVVDRSRINAAFGKGPDVLVQTVQTELGIPIHHYIEIDFFGFKDLVDALGGVTICFLFQTRDINTGLNQPPGCNLLDGVQALAYARSRHYEELRDGDWKADPTADLGRTARQRDFVNRALQAAVERIKVDPFSTGDLVDAISKALRVDGDLDPIGAASSLRAAVDGGITTFALPVVGTTIDGKAVLELGGGAGEVLAYFDGSGPPPADPKP